MPSGSTKPLSFAAVRRLSIFLLLFTACIAYTPRPIDPATAAGALQSRRLDDPALQAYVEKSLGHAVSPWPPQTWSLDELTATAFFFNPDIAVARAQHATALAAITTAKQRPNPSASASIEHKDRSLEISPWVTSYGFDIPIELPGKRTARTDQAIAAAEAARARVSIVAWEVRSRLRQQMVEVWAAGLRQDALKREADVERDIVEVFTKRLELGEAAQPELARARIALAQTQLLIEDNHRLANEARSGIAAALGLPLKSWSSNALDIKSAIVEKPSVDEALRDVALTGRADVLAALHEYAASDAALRLEVARQYPDIHLGPSFGWDQGAKTWALAVSAEIPLFNRHQGEIGEAVARRDEAAARFTAVQASVISAFDLAATQVAAAQIKLDVADSLLRSVDAQLASTRKQFEAGEIDRLALRSAELERESAALGRIDAEIDLQRSIGAVEDALQRPLGSAMPQLEEKK